MAGNFPKRCRIGMVERRQCPSLIGNFRAHQRLPQTFLDAVLRLDLELRHRALPVVAVKRQDKP